MPTQWTHFALPTFAFCSATALTIRKAAASTANSGGRGNAPGSAKKEDIRKKKID